MTDSERTAGNDRPGPASEAASRSPIEDLRAALEGGRRLIILTHDNPDPDSIASAAALSRLLRRAFHRRVTVAYGGIIGRAENQEMVRVLRIRLSHVRHLNWKHYKHFALVDSQPGTGT